MSRIFKTRQFETVCSWLILIGISAEAVRLYVTLLMWARGQGVAFPSHVQLGRLLNISVETVKKKLRELRDFGCVVPHDFFFPDGRQGPNDYEVYNDTPWPTPITDASRKVVEARRRVLKDLGIWTDWGEGVCTDPPVPTDPGTATDPGEGVPTDPPPVNTTIRKDSVPSERARSGPTGENPGGEKEPNHAWECAERILAQIADRTPGWAYTNAQVKRQLALDTPIPQLVELYGEDRVVEIWMKAVETWEHPPTWKSVLEQHNQLSDAVEGIVRSQSAKPVKRKETMIAKAERLSGRAS